MEKIHCDTCNQPTFHQTTDAYGNQIHQQGMKCLTCGGFSGNVSKPTPTLQKARWRIANDQVVQNHSEVRHS